MTDGKKNVLKVVVMMVLIIIALYQFANVVGDLDDLTNVTEQTNVTGYTNTTGE